MIDLSDEALDKWEQDAQHPWTGSLLVIALIAEVRTLRGKVDAARRVSRAALRKRDEHHHRARAAEAERARERESFTNWRNSDREYQHRVEAETEVQRLRNKMTALAEECRRAVGRENVFGEQVVTVRFVLAELDEMLAPQANRARKDNADD